jgi:hypothetical protein
MTTTPMTTRPGSAGSATAGSAAAGSAASGPAGAGPAALMPAGAGAAREPVPVPAHAMPHRSPRELLALSRHGILEASGQGTAGQRYATAHLAALRAAAAVLAARARPAVGQRRRRPTSVWVLLVSVAPELGEWAAFFAVGAAKRAAAEAGIPRVVTSREADDLLRDAERFLAVAETTLGLPHQPVLEALLTQRAG